MKIIGNKKYFLGQEALDSWPEIGPSVTATANGEGFVMDVFEFVTGNELGYSLGVVTGNELGYSLGVVTGNEIGFSLAEVAGNELGYSLGVVTGDELGL